ncbi:MAG: ABC transporter permease subunit [Acidobacteria bacterium]|nr:ABC transporter permease subunit [Acidobacteriota bacterium]
MDAHAPVAGDFPGAPARARVPLTSRRRRWSDSAARWLVVAGGLAIIAGVLGILVFILAETWPLLRPARVAVASTIAWPAARGPAVLADESRRTIVALGVDGRLRAADLRDGRAADIATLSAPAPLLHPHVLPGAQVFAAGTADGRVVLASVAWSEGTSAHDRPRPALGREVLLVLDPASRPVEAFTGTLRDDGGAIAAARLADGTLALASVTIESNPITGERSETPDQRAFPAPAPVSELAIDAAGRRLYAGTTTGQVVLWNIVDGVPGEPVAVSAGGSPVTALAPLGGHGALVVGQEDGSISVWLMARCGGAAPRPTRVREFPAVAAAVRSIAPSPRDKGFLTLDGQGGLGLHHSTSGRTLWRGPASVAGAASVVFSPKANGAIVVGARRAALLSIDNPHPEVSLRSLFLPVWYEGYDGPALVWQSSASSDDFEPKLSLTPLIVGTLKGTFYSLILAIPLGVFGAMYTSQFMHASLRNIVKPSVEIMAALPSVVLGFLAGLWLAPRVEAHFPALVLMLVVLPATALLWGWSWRLLPSRVRAALPSGSEAIAAIGFLGLGILVALQLGPAFERLAFGGRFQGWLLEVLGLTYDQRNAVVVGLAMGFAVIPIIFSVSEEAFSNVPRGLVAGSRALGATRWQTVTRVVLPSASAGIFSAVMLGFGRAVGETMIVLMATGNTPIMDWSPFNGFRTLSANIATEIPEAPVGGTLYRTLFLAGLLLFLMTFVVNTVAELVRQRLRRRFSHA